MNLAFWKQKPRVEANALDWSAQPGFHERHLRRRLNNPYFPPERRFVTRAELASARELDTKMFFGFVEAAALSNWLFDAGAVNSPMDLQQIDETIAHGKALGPRALDLVSKLEARWRAALDALDETIAQDRSEQERELLTKGRRDLRRYCELGWNQAYIDFSEVQSDDRLATLLNSDPEDLRFIFEKLSPEQSATFREALKSFATQLARECSESRAKLQSEPEKMALLGISV